MTTIHIQNIGECEKCGLALTSYFSSSEFRDGVLTDNPKECDLLIIVGCLTKKQLKPLMTFWKRMPYKHRILCFGNCGTLKQDLFTFTKEQHLKNLAIVKDDLSEVLPVDYVLEGCPPTTEQISEFLKKL